MGPDADRAGREHTAHLALACGVDGIVVANTSAGRPAGLLSPQAAEPGGLSGQPLREHAVAALRELYQLTGGRVPLVGVGGVASGLDAYQRIRAGATLVQALRPSPPRVLLVPSRFYPLSISHKTNPHTHTTAHLPTGADLCFPPLPACCFLHLPSANPAPNYRRPPPLHTHIPYMPH